MNEKNMITVEECAGQPLKSVCRKFSTVHHCPV